MTLHPTYHEDETGSQGYFLAGFVRNRSGGSHFAGCLNNIHNKREKRWMDLHPTSAALSLQGVVRFHPRDRWDAHSSLVPLGFLRHPAKWEPPNPVRSQTNPAKQYPAMQILRRADLKKGSREVQKDLQNCLFDIDIMKTAAVRPPSWCMTICGRANHLPTSQPLISGVINMWSLPKNQWFFLNFASGWTDFVFAIYNFLETEGSDCQAIRKWSNFLFWWITSH